MRLKAILLLSAFVAPSVSWSQTIPPLLMLHAADGEPASAGNVRYVGAGISGWGSGDIGAQINAAYAALPARGGTIVVVAPPNGACYNFSTPVVAASPGKYLFLEGGALASQISRATPPTCLNYVPTASMAAITLDYVPQGEPATFAVHGMQNLTLVNNQCETPGGCGSEATGVLVGGANGGAAGATFAGLKIVGFGIGLSVGRGSSRSGSLAFRECAVSYNTTGFLDTDADGGQTSFDACHFRGNGTAVSSTASVRVSNSWMEANTVVGVSCSSPAACDISSDHFENAEADSTHFLSGNGVFSVVGGDMRDDRTTGNTDWWMNFAGTSFLVLGTVLTSEGRTTNQLIRNENKGIVLVQNNTPSLLETLSLSVGNASRSVAAPSSIDSSEKTVQLPPVGVAEKAKTQSSNAIAHQQAEQSESSVSSLRGTDRILYVDGVKYGTIASAIKAAGGTIPTIIIVPSTYTGSECPPVRSNLVFWDFRGGSTRICPQNTVQYNVKTPGLTDSMIRAELTRTGVDATGSILSFYPITHLLNASVAGGVVDGAATEADIDGTLSGTLNNATGNESNVTVTSTGGSIVTASGAHGYVFSASNSTTTVTNAYGLWGLGCRGKSGTLVNCYGVFAERQLGFGTGRNYALGVNGRGLILFDGSTASGGFDFEDSAHVTHPGVFVARDDSMNLQAIGSVGLNLADNNSKTRANISSGGLRVASGIMPLDGPGAMPVGSNALPFSGIFIGGAAANNALLTGNFGQATSILLADPSQTSATLAYKNVGQRWTGDQSDMTLIKPTVNDPVVNGRITGTSIQGTDPRLLTVGDTSGTGNPLCLDAKGGATTRGCGGRLVKIARFGPSCITGHHSYSSCLSELMWDTPFPDSSYSVTCTGIGPSNPRAGLTVAQRSAASVVVNIVTYGSVAVSFSEVDCTGVSTMDVGSVSAMQEPVISNLPTDNRTQRAPIFIQREERNANPN